MKRSFGALIALTAYLIIVLLSISYRRDEERNLDLMLLEDPVPVTFVQDFGAVTPDIVGASDRRAEIIDAYFSNHRFPLIGYGAAFVLAADKYGIDFDLLPAISVRESSGGLHMCGRNPFGWGSCHLYNFNTIDEAIDYVSSRLGTSPIYQGLNNLEKLRKYNPPSIVPLYAEQVLQIMADIRMTDPNL